VREGERVLGVAMRTAPVPPHPMYVLPMPDTAALELARALHARGESLSGVNGAVPAAELVATETARLAGGTATTVQRMRLHTVDRVVPPAPVPGRLRRATLDDLDLVVRWYGAFEADAAEQAGDEHRPPAPEPQDADALRPRVEAGRIWLWTDQDGVPVHVTGYNPPAYGVVRIGPVYTPKAERGRGWAGAAVAAVTQRLLDEELRVCLFTDVANPTSNGVYERLGYRPVTDMASLVLTRPGRA
jgi:predicted GNAT family acetyltransferase